jgi:SAM-dependent methyltransferase
MSSRTAEDRRKWEELYASGSRPDRAPSPWVLNAIRRVPNDGLLLDVAGGSGRHARHVAGPERPVILADFIEEAVGRARAANASVHGVVADATQLPFRPASFSTVLVTYFLNRDIFTDLLALLAPGGHLVYETYTLDHLDLVQCGLARGPSTAEFLLKPRELLDLVTPLEVLEYWEGEVNDDAGRRCCARLIGQKPASTGQRPELISRSLASDLWPLTSGL